MPNNDYYNFSIYDQADAVSHGYVARDLGLDTKFVLAASTPISNLKNELV